MADFVDAADVRLPRVTKGRRPRFFEAEDTDQIMTFILELMAEFSALRERQDTMERLLEKNGVLQRSDLEKYVPDARVDAERSAWTNAFIRKVMRLHNPA